MIGVVMQKGEVSMRMIDKIRQMDEYELAEWLCNQLWKDYKKEDVSLKVMRSHQVRNFLLMEVEHDES